MSGTRWAFCTRKWTPTKSVCTVQYCAFVELNISAPAFQYYQITDVYIITTPYIAFDIGKDQSRGCRGGGESSCPVKMNIKWMWLLLELHIQSYTNCTLQEC
jgi:hypothetical protein